MSWSISTEGTAEECIEKAREKQPAAEANLPDAEKPQVGQVIDTADTLLALVPDGHKVILNLSGSISTQNDEVVAGSLGIGVSYQK